MVKKDGIGKKTSRRSFENDLWDDSNITEDEFENVEDDFMDESIKVLSSDNSEYRKDMLLEGFGKDDDDLFPSSVVNKKESSIEKNKSNIGPLTAAILAAGTTGGTTYAFGLYASALKQELQLNQSELSTISATFFCAGLVSWLPGLAVDRFGPKISLVTGGILGSISLLAYWAVAMHRGVFTVSRDHVVITLSILGVATYMSSALVTGSVFKLIVRCCGRGTKGIAVGVAKGYVGLGSGAYTCIFESLQRNHHDWSDLNFLPVAAFFAFAAVVLPALCLVDSSEKRANVKVVLKDLTTPLHFKFINSGLLLLGTVVVGKSLSELFYGSSTEEEFKDEVRNQTKSQISSNYAFASFVIIAWFGPIASILCLPVARLDGQNSDENEEEQIELIQRTNNNSTIEISSHGIDSLSEIENGSSKTSATEKSFDDEDDENDNFEPNSVRNSSRPASNKLYTQSIGGELSLSQMLQTMPAWLLLWTCTILAGGGTVMTNHVGQMSESLRLPPAAGPSSLALFSAAQAASRVLTGSISESLLNSSWNIPRPFFLVLASLCCGFAHLLMASVTSQVWFIVAVIISGYAFGMIWPLMVLIVGECFGTANVGANYMFYDGVTSAIGTLILSKFVAQEVYENHIMYDENYPKSILNQNIVCYGQYCYQKTHYIVAGLSLTCIVTSIMITNRTRYIYKK